MKTFEDLEFKTDKALDREQAIMNFDNNYGVSVLKTQGSYGYEQDLWEIGILYNNELTYNTHITDDVLGYQTNEDVTEVMKQVQELK